ncbi:alpha/beta fold hydrolase [Yinghuangia sp. YIM S09857]|uniref:alpha/beta fold hydrolase n=1 Tax=Yinghuangia sp. YIM S09857 TaxID=3436929 RepID=UPI003F535BFB
MTPSTEHTILPLDAGDIHICQDGPCDAPALLLIHGSAASTTSWDLLVPLLTASHHVIRIDLLGHGRSAKPADRQGYAVPRQGRTVAAALDRLGITRVTAVGHSSGGYTATALTEHRPDLVGGLALVNTGPGLHAYTAPDALAIDPAQWPPTDAQIRQLAATGFTEGYELPRHMVDEVRETPLHAFAGTLQASTAYLAEGPVPDRLKHLGKPLHVIYGDLDRRWSPASFEDYRAVPDAAITAIPDTGHSPILEVPDRTAELLLAFTKLHV